MEGMDEIEDPTFFLEETNDDLCLSILSRFSNSTKEDHQHLCSVIGAMSQELKDQNLPSSPVAYFGAACSSLDRLAFELDPPAHVVNALLTILHLVLPRIPPAIRKKKADFLSELLVRVLRSPLLSVGAVISGLKCTSHLLNNRDSINWSDICHLYGVLLGFLTDSRPKVRRQSHVCLRDTLSRFQETSVLAPACEGITKIFEKSLLLAGGSNVNATEGPKGAQEVLYILDALKECLPHMSTKYTTSILKYYKSLLELHQPPVTRRITDSLYLLCLVPALAVSPEALLDLLDSVSLSVSTNETSADSMTFAARLLDVGMCKMYSLNRQLCVTKLPVVFNALKDILASEHEEAVYAATNAMKNVTSACIDESLIKQGMDQILTNANNDSRQSGPTIIEKVCATIESLLGYHYAAVWDMSFQVVSTMFDKLGHHSSYFLKEVLSNLADMQKLPDEDFPFRKQLHECLGTALGALGPEMFLGLVPLNLEAEDLSEANVWLFPILKQYTVGARLSFFTESVLGMIGLMKQKSQKLELQGRVFSSRSANALVYSLWSLLPSFCNYPLDTADSFKHLKKALWDALNEEADTRGIICASLQILIQQNKKISDEKSEMPNIEEGMARQRALAHYTLQIAADNLHALKSSAREALTILSNVLMQSTKDDGGSLQSTIGEFASISDKEVVSRFFLSTVQKLLKVTQEAGKPGNSRTSNSIPTNPLANDSSPSLLRARFFDLAVSLLPGLNAKEIDVLFLAIKPALKDADGLIQKKAYKVLSVILRNCDGFLVSNLEELLGLMIDVLPSCHFSAKRHRLDCLYFLTVHVPKDDSNQRQHIIGSFLTEIILALKEANKKTRNRAYEILVQIGHACGDEEKGGNRENLYQFFSMVAGGLASETPHMVSAAVKGLARLAYEFSDLVSTACGLLPSTFLLLRRKNKEIIKANLGLLKVLVTKSQPEGLQMHLGSMVEGLFKWQDNTKNHFKAKVKHLLEILVKKCGLEAVKAVMPEEHMKLLTNIRKINERKERNLRAKSEARSQLSKATTSRLSRWNHTKIFSDFGDDETEESDAEHMEAMTISGQQHKGSSQLKSKASLRSRSRAAMNLPEHLFDQFEDEPLDLLDRRKTISALRSSKHVKRKLDSDEPELDSEGRLIIHEGENSKQTPSDPDLDAKSEAGSQMSLNSRRNQKRRKTSASGWAYTGSEYTSKKAGGDVKRKDKLEPYAYWPLDRKMMSRRPEHRAAARKGMASVVKMTKKLEGKSASSLLSSKGLKFKRSQKKKGSKK
ncbi:RRP12-like protein [Juglans microcarpa x Juglans regia]|uniref:RRP12-like protein n=1 Tax=Juglans microcarpa x Juglans regia TaxID=2249226 RepID=UPI001B7EEFC7|nr:RRP12-like protein [Juglans microcarpa x Juglans regia]